jgi:hypothetical protein
MLELSLKGVKVEKPLILELADGVLPLSFSFSFSFEFAFLSSIYFYPILYYFETLLPILAELSLFKNLT